MENSAVKIDIEDTLLTAMNDALARSKSVFSNCAPTLVSTISQNDWDTWDASSEIPNVADQDPVDYEDDFDCDEKTAA